MKYELYVIIDRDGVLRERSAADMTRSETISDILHNQIEGAAKVLCICPQENTCRDVTEDIALEVLKCAFDHCIGLRGAARDFVEENIGCQSLAIEETENHMQARGWARQTHSAHRA